MAHNVITACNITMMKQCKYMIDIYMETHHITLRHLLYNNYYIQFDHNAMCTQYFNNTEFLQNISYIAHTCFIFFSILH